jgi:hypothetical protein
MNTELNVWPVWTVLCLFPISILGVGVSGGDV